MTLQSTLLVFGNGQQQVMLRGKVAVERGAARITGLTPITEDLTRELLAQADRAPLEYRAENVLANNLHACAWFVPARTRVMRYQPSYDQSLRSLDHRPFAQPPLIFISRTDTHQNSLQVYALSENVRPQPETPVMYAPFLNIYDGDRVCFGASQLPPGTTTAYQHAWETLFYATPFSHPGGTHRRWHPSLTYTEVWEHAANHPFDPAHLTPTGRTLEDILCTPYTAL